MSKIMEAWEQLLRDAVSSDSDQQEYALFQIGLILQRHNPHVTPDSDVYEEELSRELLRLTLNDQRQKDAVDYLIALANQKSQPLDSLLFALSNAQPKILAEPLIAFLQAEGKGFKKDAGYQATTALETLFKFGDATVLEQLKNSQLMDLLDEWSENNDALLSSKADSLAAKLEGLQEDD